MNLFGKIKDVLDEADREEGALRALAGGLVEQINRLSEFIMREVPNEPSKNEGAIDTAIRVIRRLQEGITLKLEEGERQMVLMALAHLCAERPGWDHALADIALRIDNVQAGRPVLFDSFRELKSSTELPQQAWARAATLMRSMIQTHGKIPDDDPVWGVEIPEYRPPEVY